MSVGFVNRMASEDFTADLPPRPLAATAGAALLLGSALVLVLTWALGVDAVASNGARVFFVVVWGYLAWAAFHGGGWVRMAIVAIFAITVWGSFNSRSFAATWQAMPAGEVIAEVFALCALAVMWLPPAHRWFAAAKERRG